MCAYQRVATLLEDRGEENPQPADPTIVDRIAELAQEQAKAKKEAQRLKRQEQATVLANAKAQLAAAKVCSRSFV